MLKEGIIEHNPASDLELPKEEQRLPSNILSVSEAERILNQPNVNTPIGIRDRAMLETFYSTAMRRSELINLEIYDLDTERGIILIRQGKGKKDRNVPIGVRALKWLKKYIEDVRPIFAENTQTNIVFLSVRGQKFGAANLSALTRDYMNAAGIRKRGSCHVFRHTAATQMLENGAHLRCLQELLGHAELATTQIYTHVGIKQLKEIHSKTHPADLPPEREESNGANSDGTLH